MTLSNFETGLTVNKIYIDSRFRTASSRSDTDFSIELPETVYLPVGTRCYVTDISLVHAWYTIEDDINNKLYFTYKTPTDTYESIITIDSRNYSLDTLVDELQLKFETMRLSAPSWFQLAFVPSVVADDTTGTLTIANVASPNANHQFFIWSDVDLADETFYKAWRGDSYNRIFPASINRLMKNYVTQTNSSTKPFKSGFVDTITHHSIYIKSPQLGTFQNIGPTGERDILKKICVNVPFGDIITHDWLMSEDFTDCSRLTLKTLYFRVTDVNNTPLNLHGHHVSFSLIFSA